MSVSGKHCEHLDLGVQGPAQIWELEIDSGSVFCSQGQGERICRDVYEEMEKKVMEKFLEDQSLLTAS